jgi:hypothetical protein
VPPLGLIVAARTGLAEPSGIAMLSGVEEKLTGALRAVEIAMRIAASWLMPAVYGRARRQPPKDGDGTGGLIGVERRHSRPAAA